MKFRCEHVFNNISVADYEKLFFDEEFNTALCAAVNLGRKIIKHDLTNGALTRILRITPDREVPGPVAKIIGSAKIEYTEYMDYKFGGYKGVWRTESSVLTDKVDTRGTVSFAARGNGVSRVAEGEIKVKIFGVGGIIERFIVADIEKSYDRAADFTHKWLAEKRTSA